MRKAIRIEIMDFTAFMKENLVDIVEQSNTGTMEALGNIFNKEVQSLSNGHYGYFWDEEEDGDNGY